MLDVGGGPGYFRDAFEGAGATYFALDADVGELSGLGGSRAGTVLGSGMQLPFADDTFDVCYSSNVLEHVSEPWRMADEMVRVTRPGGLVFISLHGLVRALGRARDGARGTTSAAAAPRAATGAGTATSPRTSSVSRCSRSRCGPVCAWAARQDRRRGRSTCVPRYNPRWARWLSRVPGAARGRHLEPGHRPAPAMTCPPPRASPAPVTWRFRLAVCCLALVALAFSQRPGRQVSDTKFDLVVDPRRMLARALHMWDPTGGFGQVQNQAYGYLFPMGPFFWLGDLASVPAWAVQRAWWSLLLVVAFLGVGQAVRGAGARHPDQPDRGRLRLRPVAADPHHPRPHLDRGVAHGARPVGAGAARARRRGEGRRSARPRSRRWRSRRSAASTPPPRRAVLPLGAVWLLTAHPRAAPTCAAGVVARPRRAGHAVVAGAAVPARAATARPSSTSSRRPRSRPSPPRPSTCCAARRTGCRTSTPTWQAGNDLLTTGYVAINAAVLLVLGLVGLSLRGNPHRSVLVLGLLAGLVLVSLGHSGAVHGWFAGAERTALDGALAPLRNVHKFDPVLRLPLVLGLAHLLGALAATGSGPRPRPP